jgi:MFS family permease
MVLLAACLFTTMNSFQTTFADSRNLSYDIFYASYTVAVITVRLGLSPLLPDSASDRVVRLSTAGIVVAVLGFLLVGSNPILYGVVSVLLGITYGMALPALQARAVNLADPPQRPKLLPLAGLLFETAILAFPLAAGFLIRVGNYRLLFGVLLVFSLGIALLALRTPARPAEVAG